MFKFFTLVWSNLPFLDRIYCFYNKNWFNSKNVAVARLHCHSRDRKINIFLSCFYYFLGFFSKLNIVSRLFISVYTLSPTRLFFSTNTLSSLYVFPSPLPPLCLPPTCDYWLTCLTSFSWPSFNFICAAAKLCIPVFSHRIKCCALFSPPPPQPPVLIVGHSPVAFEAVACDSFAPWWHPCFIQENKGQCESTLQLVTDHMTPGFTVVAMLW